MRACLRTGANQRYIARRTMAGVTRTIDVLFVLVPERHEDDAFIIASARDITDMQHIEDQLHQAQKMEAVGQPSITKARFSTCWCNAAATPERRCG